MLHHRVAGNDRLIDLPGLNVARAAHLLDAVIEQVDHCSLQPQSMFSASGGVGDAADDVLAIAALCVQPGARGQMAAVGQIDEFAHHRGGAQIHRQAVNPALIGRLQIRHDIIDKDRCGGKLELPHLLAHLRQQQRRQLCRRRRGLQRVQQQLLVRDRTVQIRSGYGYRNSAHSRLQRHPACFALAEDIPFVVCSGLGHGDDAIGIDRTGAGQPPALAQLFSCQLNLILFRGRNIQVVHVHPAAAADAVAAAIGRQVDAKPARRFKDRDARGKFCGEAFRQKG